MGVSARVGGRVGSFKIGRPRPRGLGNFGRRWTGGVLKIRQFPWTSNVHCPLLQKFSNAKMVKLVIMLRQ